MDHKLARPPKAPLHLLPAAALEAASAAFLDGACKYEPWNWGPSHGTREEIEAYAASAMRHLLAFTDPTRADYDAESGLHHVAHAIAATMIVAAKLGLEYQIPRSYSGGDGAPSGTLPTWHDSETNPPQLPRR